MSQPTNPEPSGSLGPVLAVIVVSIAIAGYFIGLQAPMTDHRSSLVSSSAAKTNTDSASLAAKSSGETARLGSQPASQQVLPATHYEEMAVAIRANNKQSKDRKSWTEKFGNPNPGIHMPQPASVESLPGTTSTEGFESDSYLPGQEQIVIAPTDKNYALELRQLNRAFNGAPPLFHILSTKCRLNLAYCVTDWGLA